MVNSLMWMLASTAMALGTLLAPTVASALLPQTRRDLRVVEDRLRYEFSADRSHGRMTPPLITPILVATPQAHWRDSVADFAPATMEVLRRVFPEPGALIACPECAQSRVFVARDNRLVVDNGELGLSDLAGLRERPEFKAAKSILLARETPSGVDVRVIAIEDGRILYTGLSDSTTTLDDAQPPLHLAREMDRRKRGEALSYVHLDLGLYPTGLAQASWLEQWGDHNQHLSGLALGLYNPTGAIGAAYYYMLPFRRRMTIGIIGYYSLQGMFSSASANASKDVIAQGSLNYAISGSYGVFVSGDTQGTISVGLSMLNPVLFPFLF